MLVAQDHENVDKPGRTGGVNVGVGVGLARDVPLGARLGERGIDLRNGESALVMVEQNGQPCPFGYAKGIAHVKVVARSGVVQCHEHGDALTF